MGNPVSIPCIAGAWTPVAVGVTSGTIFKQSSKPAAYTQTYKLTGEAAPTDDDEAGPLFENDDSAAISHNVAIDVYVKAITTAGAVRVDL